MNSLFDILKYFFLLVIYSLIEFGMLFVWGRVKGLRFYQILQKLIHYSWIIIIVSGIGSLFDIVYYEFNINLVGIKLSDLSVPFLVGGVFVIGVVVFK
mgnify:CR=1 FL=1